MLFNIVTGFIIPWLLASPLVQKQPRLFIVISPISALISLIINTIGFYFDFWHFKPIFSKNETISALPLDFGLYAVLGPLFIFFITKRPFGIPALISFLSFSLLATLLEFLGLQFNRVMYSNGWNIGWTFISYAIGFLAVATAWRTVRSYFELVK
ncbi:hypothetical protein D3P08_21070 [Paenibacillus nanensis]|uniref:Uncharacterized protein n=1 Tax=Paenibacillus nanensis TaxID=393251 RepID=A0A3A1UNE0_9BACL|nr:hypothetical protein D3P08_21070 [Paenibacillus nanensis]